MYSEGAGGKPGLISFYNCRYGVQHKILVSIPRKNRTNMLWLVGPAVLVVSFIFTSFFLCKILSTIFEDSLITDHLRRPIGPLSSSNIRNLNPQVGHIISSVLVLVHSLLIPMVTLDFVWPWTGPAASSTLASYLVDIVVHFAFEQYARCTKSPSWPVIPILFQVTPTA